MNDPVRPFTAILGGAKVADKLNVISNLLEKVDTLIIGGGMAYTFIKAQGYEVGKSLCDDSKLDYCKEMMAKAQEKGVKLLLPVDTACVENFPDPIDAPVETTVVPVTAIPADKEGCDIGPETMKLFADAVKLPRPSSGTAPWVSLRTRLWLPALWPWPRLWLRATLPPSSAAATAQQLSSRWVWATR